MKNNIEIKEFELDDFEQFNQLSEKENLLNKDLYNINYFSWKFLQNNIGKSKYFFFRSASKSIVGRIVSTVMSGSICLKKIKYKIYFLSDLIIEKKYRSPINNLINLYKVCLNKTDGIIMQSSNKQSEKFYEKVLQKKSSFYLKSYGIPISSKSLPNKNFFIIKIFNLLIRIYFIFCFLIRLISKKFSTIKVVKTSNLTPDIMNKIKSELIKKNIIFLDRNVEFIEWRINLLQNKDIFLIYDKNKEVIGYLITTNKNILNMNNFIILDYLVSKKLNFINKIFLRLKILNFSKNKLSDNLFTMGNPKSFIFNMLSGFPYFKIPDIFLPHETPIYFHNIKEKLIQDEILKLNISPADMDYF